MALDPGGIMVNLFPFAREMPPELSAEDKDKWHKLRKMTPTPSNSGKKKRGGERVHASAIEVID